MSTSSRPTQCELVGTEREKRNRVFNDALGTTLQRCCDMLELSMPRKLKRLTHTQVSIDRYDTFLAEVVDLLEAARRTSARAVNAVMTATYWQIGRRIVEAKQELSGGC